MTLDPRPRCAAGCGRRVLLTDVFCDPCLAAIHAADLSEAGDDSGGHSVGPTWENLDLGVLVETQHDFRPGSEAPTLLHRRPGA
jgi:hypothetical protein